MPPILDYRSPRWVTTYDVLDEVRRLPGIFLGGLNAEWIAGSRMPRLQAFLRGLAFAKLEDGTPPFSLFSAWLSVQQDGIPDSHNLPLHWLEQTFGPDRAFDIFFERLDEYRSCDLVELARSHGPFAPRFTVGLEHAVPEHPSHVVVSRFIPSNVHCWAAVHGDEVDINMTFFAGLDAAKRDASERWGVGLATWSHGA